MEGFDRVNKLTLISWQHKDTYRAEPEVFDAFRQKALVYKGPNGLLASSDGVVKLASCKAIQPWLLDSEYQAALRPEALELVSWNNSFWG